MIKDYSEILVFGLVGLSIIGYILFFNNNTFYLINLILMIIITILWSYDFQKLGWLG